MLALCVTFLLSVGAIVFGFPDAVYELTESWESNFSGELSKLHRWNTRIGGIVCALAGFGGVLSFFVR